MSAAAASDFNDMNTIRGPAAVREVFEKATKPRVVVCDALDLMVMPWPERETLLSPFLQSQSLTMIHAWRGVGKTHMSLGLAYALASGGEFLGWRATRQVPVLYIDGEMPGAALKERVARIAASCDLEAGPGMLKFITPDLQPEGVMPNLAEHEGQAAINSVIGDAQVIIVDNLSCLVRGVKENEGDGWAPIAEWGLRMRAAGRSVIFVHHSGKGGGQRGTSKREDLLDVVIALRRPSDYQPDEGARFEVHFEKARSLYGQEVSPIEATLNTTVDGHQTWKVRTVEAIADAQMIDLAELGMPHADIARELGVHRSTVMRSLRKAEQEGRHIAKVKKAGAK